MQILDVLEYNGKEKAFFQAIGYVKSEVEEREGKFYIEIDNREYLLDSYNKRLIDYFRMELLSNKSNSTKDLIVFPKFTHFPQKEKETKVHFNLVGWGENKLIEVLEPKEFILRGVYQTIPHHSLPVVSIYRNNNSQLQKFIGTKKPLVKKSILKANHLPVEWITKEKPYRYSQKEEGKKEKKFVQLLARFSAKKQTFFIRKSIVSPSLSIPSFLKYNSSAKKKHS